MKTIFFVLLTVIIFIACNSSENRKTTHSDIETLRNLCIEYSDLEHPLVVYDADLFLYRSDSSNSTKEMLRRGKEKASEARKKIKIVAKQLLALSDSLEKSTLSDLSDSEIFTLQWASMIKDRSYFSSVFE